ncbi:SOS response-associated peptidase family protein [Streptomyces sp. NPDC016459]|uniref:SOS response-associated peptidase family protein n=1 Tax=Streptomyces sp. NPDC016459 TaxID=3157190 RepID=UPI0034063161
MCGRYASTRGPEDLSRLVQATDWTPAKTPAPSWNVAPTDEVYAVLERTARDDGDEVPRQGLRSNE